MRLSRLHALGRFHREVGGAVPGHGEARRVRVGQRVISQEHRTDRPPLRRQSLRLQIEAASLCQFHTSYHAPPEKKIPRVLRAIAFPSTFATRNSRFSEGAEYSEQAHPGEWREN